MPNFGLTRITVSTLESWEFQFLYLVRIIWVMVVMVLPKEPEVLGKCSNPGRDSYSTQVEEEKTEEGISKKNWKVGKVNYTSNTSMMRVVRWWRTHRIKCCWETLGTVAGQLADDLEVVQLRLQDHDDGDDGDYDHVQDQDQYFNRWTIIKLKTWRPVRHFCPAATRLWLSCSKSLFVFCHDYVSCLALSLSILYLEKVGQQLPQLFLLHWLEQAAQDVSQHSLDENCGDNVLKIVMETNK